MTTSEDVNEFANSSINRLDRLLQNGEVIPADIYFICTLFSEYYEGQSPEKVSEVSETFVEFALQLASSAAEIVTTDDEASWIHAHNIINSYYTMELWDRVNYSNLDYSAKTDPEANININFDDNIQHNGLSKVIGELTNELEHVDFSSSSSVMEKNNELGMILSNLGKRYAGYLPYESLESRHSVKLIDLLKEYRDEDEISDRELIKAFRLVSQWTKLRANHEYELITKM